jgi:hypothetical protein
MLLLQPQPQQHCSLSFLRCLACCCCNWLCTIRLCEININFHECINILQPLLLLLL